MLRVMAVTLPLALLACSADNATGQNAGATAGEKPFKTSVIADFTSPGR